MTTLKEIAKYFDVSTATISYVANDKWRKNGIRKNLAEKIQKKLQEENYSPNVLGLQLKTRKTQTIGLILGDLTRPFNLEILAGIEKVLAAANYITIVCNSDQGRLEESQLNNLRARNVEGIIVFPSSNGTTTGLLREMINHNISVVMVDNYLPELEADFVVSDNSWGSGQAVKFIIDKGCRKIAYLGSGKNLAALNERYAGYLSALKAKKLPLSKDLVWRKARGPEDVYFALKEIFSQGKPDAIFCESLLYFNEGFRFLAERKLTIPDDIFVTGFDSPSLTVNETHKLRFHSLVKKPIPFVQQAGTRMGELAAQMLLDRIGCKEKKVSRKFLKPQLKHFTTEGEITP